VLAWILVLVFLWTTAAFAILWLFTRQKNQRLENSTSHSNAATESPPHRSTKATSADNGTSAAASNSIDENVDYELIDLNSTIIDEETLFYGVAKPEAKNAAAATFLIPQDMGGFEPGDRFTKQNGQLVKLQPGQSSTAEETLSGSANANGAVDGKTVFNQSVVPNQASKTDIQPYLKVTDGPDVDQIFSLDFNKTVVGRETDCEVILSDTGLSRKHCRVEWTGTAFTLVDNESTNGTFCNGEPVQSKSLEFGDTVRISDTTLLFSTAAFDMKSADTAKAIDLFQSTLSVEPNFVTSMKHLAFLMEKDIRLKKDAAPLWKKIAKLEK